MQMKTSLLIPKAPFYRVVRGISSEFGSYRFEAGALEALQEAAEAALVHELERMSISIIIIFMLYTNLYSKQSGGNSCEKSHHPGERHEAGATNEVRDAGLRETRPTALEFFFNALIIMIRMILG
jgi:hypothetical protein